ncbi:MAG: penicillin acylase family protein, partial [Planctomycetes bacterium]|nr:penicillin acylase family protein [Planctomycetota bacterium]
MNKARNLDEFIEAMRMLQMMPQNILYADVHGDMYYVRNGRVPIRPEGFEFSVPVPGAVSDTEWLGIHDYDDLVQIKNPPAGFLQNCNISPGTMTFDSPATPEKYPSYIYNAEADGTNSRADRFLALIKEKDKIAKEDALAIANDITFHNAEEYKKAIVDACETGASSGPKLGQAVEIIRNWDGRAAADSPGMTLFYTWWREMVKRDEGLLSKVQAGENQADTVQCLERAVAHLKEKFGRIDVPWGEVFRMKRGDRTWPLSGVADKGLVTLRAVGGRDKDDTGVLTAYRGQTAVAVVFLGDPVTAYSAVPYGQSDRPDSPHFDDQAEQLFSKCRLKPTWYQKSELMENLESEQTLEAEAPLRTE